MSRDALPPDTTPPPLDRAGREAIVLGGGIAGLGAAIALAPHFEHVTLLERDTYPPGAGARSHAAQGEHVHLLLAAGVLALESLVPELPRWMDELGLRRGDLTHHTRVAYDGRWLPKTTSGIPLRVATRGDVELLLRRKVALLANITHCEGVTALGLVGSLHRVEGVRLGRGDATHVREADLVVDAMGRTTALPGWLGAMGAPPFTPLEVDARVVYASAWFEAPAVDDDWAVLATLPSLPRSPTMSVAVRYGRRMLVSAICYGHQQVPRNVAELVDFMKGVGVPQLHALVRRATPASAVTVFGNTRNRWHRHGSAPWWPERLVALGDSVCALNPRYGQGMTVAARSVALLAAELGTRLGGAGSLDGFARAFQASLDAELRTPWHMALLEDRSWAQALAGRPASAWQRLTGWTSQRLLRRAFSDVETYVQFMRVAQLLDGPATLALPALRACLTPPSMPTVDEAPVVERVDAGLGRLALPAATAPAVQGLDG